MKTISVAGFSVKAFFWRAIEPHILDSSGSYNFPIEPYCIRKGDFFIKSI